MLTPRRPARKIARRPLLSGVIAGLTFLGLAAFFAWMAAMGIALLRRRPLTEGWRRWGCRASR